MKKILLLLSLVALWACDCPYNEYGERRFEQGYYNSSYSSKYDKFYADVLIGGWQCSYNMNIMGIGEALDDQPNAVYQMQWISFINSRKCDITFKAVGSIESRVYTFDYLYDGNALRFSRNHRTIILTLNGFIYPELYLRDSYGRYTLTKRRVAGY
jgi:hypothetical protein